MKIKPRALLNVFYQTALVLLVAVLLTGCGGVTATLEPTIDTQPTLQMVQTEAAQTVIADLTQKAPSSTPVVITDTPAPTDTPVPTNTPENTATFTEIPPSPTSTRIPATSTPAPTATLANLNCTIEEQGVGFGDDFPPNADFDGRWKIKNTGTDTWTTSAVDVKYLSGTKFQTKVDIFDLPSDVAPGGSITIFVDMRAPDTIGRYTTSWGLVQGSTTICVMSITLDVVK